MSLPSLPSLPPAVYIAGLVSLSVALLLVLTQRWHGRFSMDGLKGVQKMHTTPTPRIGGIAIFVGVMASWFVAPADVARILGALAWAGLPAFAFGLAEDLTKQVSMGLRLLATMASGVLGWWITGYSLTSVDVPLIDTLLLWAPASVLFTAFAVGGVANAVNIIDGFNGLASGFVILGFFGLGTIAGLHSDASLCVACFALAAAMIGFWLVNWPWGKIFLGDGGSYFGGFALAWASVMLVERNSEITPFAALLICIHPITEVLFSILRRRLKKMHPGHPDRLHLHSLIMRRVVSHALLRLNGGDYKQMIRMRNPATGLAIALLSIPSVFTAIWLAETSGLAAGASMIFVVGYVAIYVRLVRFRWTSPVCFLWRSVLR